MTTIILHNKHDADSRKLVKDALKENPEAVVIDWYDEEDRKKYLEMGGNMIVSALPSVVDLSDKDKKVDFIVRLPDTWAKAKTDLVNKGKVG